MTDAPTPTPALRSDAARNMAKVLDAARSAFDEEGLDVGVEVIAQRAGVGVGTIYRRFSTKDLLIDAVVEELLLEVLHMANDALALQSPATGFTEFLRSNSQLQAVHARCLDRLWNDPAQRPVRAKIETAMRLLLEQAQAAGTIRRDVVYEDVVMLHWSLRGVIETTNTVAPNTWLRHLDLLLAGLAPSPHDLPHLPLTSKQLQEIDRLRTQ